MSIERLVSIAFKAHGVRETSDPVDKQRIYWKDSFYGLTQTKIWNSLEADAKSQVLQDQSNYLLGEAIEIENAGMLYAAKMNTLAQSQDERSFFCVMGFEEAKHLRLLSAFSGSPTTQNSSSSFAQLIRQIVSDCDRRSSLFLIQILLEGWGLSYYQSLAEDCQNQNLRAVFNSIVQDETRHHSAGILLFDKEASSKSDEAIVLGFNRILDMVRSGPDQLLKSILKFAPDTNGSQILEFMNEIGAKNATEFKLRKLKNFAETHLSTSTLKDIERSNPWREINFHTDSHLSLL